MALGTSVETVFVKSSNYIDTRLETEVHPLASQVRTEVDNYFLEHWPFPNKQARKKFKAAGLSLAACYFIPRALDDRLHFACRLFAWAFLIDDSHDDLSLDDGRAHNEEVIRFCRGDTLPDRNAPIEWITWDLWESLRAYDRELADDMLEPCIVWLRSQTDPRRLKQLDLKEYLEYREADVGHDFTASMIRFCMGLHISPQERSIARSIEENCSKHITVINDIWSYEREILAAQNGHPEGGILLSAVSTFSDATGVSTEASKKILCGLCREWELVHEQLAREVLDVTQNEAMKEYLKALELEISGNEAWSKSTVRYTWLN
ncbi:hypothetical protein O1611_g7090 [Lasiodiplodia mahajangana]|uniref:Uncharacterized protein n=1 Tax=Lasiodiplodia mahajangana TaxID=1108764 RepID=A0ACC2JGB8_9PEZI|nr:hypothetical protein O1611_g7090 [Lasiodiplodia mahajangana]